jgi:hypothetical protein
VLRVVAYASAGRGGERVTERERERAREGERETERERERAKEREGRGKGGRKRGVPSPGSAGQARETDVLI